MEYDRCCLPSEVLEAQRWDGEPQSARPLKDAVAVRHPTLNRYPARCVNTGRGTTTLPLTGTISQICKLLYSECTLHTLCHIMSCRQPKAVQGLFPPPRETWRLAQLVE